jgi:hypothetical protein
VSGQPQQQWRPGRPALTGTAEVRLHFHGVTAQDVSAILTGVNQDRG